MSKEIKKEKKSKVEKAEKKAKKSEKIVKQDKKRVAAAAFSLLVDDKAVDKSLSSLFAVKQPPVKAKPGPIVEKAAKKADPSEEDEDEDNDAELSEIDEDISDDAADDAESEAEEEVATPENVLKEVANDDAEDGAHTKRKRKRKSGDEELEDKYMSMLAREEEKENKRLAAERAAKRQKQDTETGATEGAEDEDAESNDEADEDVVSENDSGEEGEDKAMSPPPKHETEQQADEELDKANRTVFLGNVSTAAITSKSSRKTLLNHLASFFSKLPTSKDKTKPAVESIRFRSTPYASAIPKKAAYAKQELMDATSKSTNAYAVYSSPSLSREAAKRLNGTVVLDRHLRVDEVAHPSQIDNRRCIFVGNLGFVSDESNIQAANEADGRETRKPGKEPADVEEGLWRTFNKCGKVESVRVIRDSTTRVGKGIAYVQFEDENGVEAALLYNEKKFPPMLPRKLRVTRAKAIKRNAKPGSGRPTTSKPGANTGYQRKLTGEEASKLGRTSKLFGRAAAAQARKPEPRTERPQKPSAPALGEGIKKPESFIFEGHRAKSSQGKSGLKLGGKHAGKKSSKVTKRSSSYKAKKKAA